MAVPDRDEAAARLHVVDLVSAPAPPAPICAVAPGKAAPPRDRRQAIIMRQRREIAALKTQMSALEWEQAGKQDKPDEAKDSLGLRTHMSLINGSPSTASLARRLKRSKHFISIVSGRTNRECKSGTSNKWRIVAWNEIKAEGN